MKSPQKIRLLIVDDQALFREGLVTLLSVKDDIEVVGEASNGEEAVRLAVGLKPHVILMDLRMPILDGVTATRRITAQLPDCKVIVLTTFDDDESVFDGLRAGAVGYLLKDVSSEKLFEAVYSAARGEYFLQPAITEKVVSEFSRLSRLAGANAGDGVQLSNREIEILELVSTGAGNRAIGEQLFIAEGTVKNHLTNILSKLQVKDRLQAVEKAKEIGLM